MNTINAAKIWTLNLGKPGEHDVTCFDFSEFYNACVSEYGEGVLNLAHKRRGISYTPNLIGVTWTIQEEDVMTPGEGVVELTFTASSGAVKKSRVWKTVTHCSPIPTSLDE